MADILATNDQENAIYGRQQAAATKPLNQLRPKTPGNKLGKIGFRDENAVHTQGKGKVVMKRGGNENVVYQGQKTVKQDPSTPMIPKNRAPLGAKTTNAKARPFSTPVIQNKDADKLRSASAARRNRIKIIESQPSNVDVLRDDNDIPDIEYMPPKVKDLPDIPQELENGINLSMFDNGGMQRDVFKYMWLSKGADGKSLLERDEERAQKLQVIQDAEDEAFADYALDLDSAMCAHSPDCPTEECKDAPEKRNQAKQRLDERLAEIRKGDQPPAFYKSLSSSTKPTVSRINITKGPSLNASKSAASVLANSHLREAASRPINKSLVSRSNSKPLTNKTPAIKATNPSTMRHTAAVAASNSTLGYGKGRAARSNLRQGILGPKDTNVKAKDSSRNFSSKADEPIKDLNALSPAEYMRLHGEPKFLSEMWWKCKTAGLIKMPGEEDKKDKEEDINAVLFQSLDLERFEREEAEREFELVL